VISCEIRDKRNDNATDFSPNFFGFPLLIMLPPWRCPIALIRQYSIISSIFKLGASFLTQHLAGHRVRNLVLDEEVKLNIHAF
jgi:hypothetical protein